ncbi:hypothetical protein JCM9492_05760 [Aquifex pyrophilus]
MVKRRVISLLIYIPLLLVSFPTFSLTENEIIRIIKKLEEEGLYEEAKKYKELLKNKKIEERRESSENTQKKEEKKGKLKKQSKKEKSKRKLKESLVIWKYIQEDPQKAIEILERKPKTPDNLKALGIAYYNLGDYFKAIEYLKNYTKTKKFKRDKDKYRIYLLLAYAYKNVLDEKNFKKYMLKVYRSKPELLTPADKLSIAFVFLNEGQLDKVREIINSLSSEELRKLDSEALLNLYALYYVKKGYLFLKKGNYEKAYEYAKRAQKYRPNMREAMELEAWALLNLEDYDGALKLFKEIVKYKETPSIYYALALAYAKKGDKNEAEKYLKLAEKEADRLLMYKIAQLYYALGEKEDALRVLNKLKKGYAKVQKEDMFELAEEIEEVETEEELKELPFIGEESSKEKKENFKKKIRKEVRKENSSYSYVLMEKLKGEVKSGLRFGLFSSFKSGEKGAGALFSHRFTLEVFRLKESEIKAYDLATGLDFYYLDSGKPEGNTWANVGLGEEDDSYKSSVYGVSPYVRIYYIHYKGISGEIYLSTTPIGFVLSPELVYNFRLGYKKNYIEIYKEPIKESLLSFSGNEVNGLKWGRVTKEGISLRLELQSKFFGISLKNKYSYRIKGENTIENKAFELTLLPYVQLHNTTEMFEGYEHFIVGPMLFYQAFDKNTNFYTFGHGGYFSPQRFLLVGIFGDIRKKFSKDTVGRLSGTIGFLSFEEEPTRNFPFSDDSTYYNGKSEKTLGYSLRAYLIHLFDRKLSITGFVAFDNSKDYSVIGAGGFITYYFSGTDYLMNIEERSLKTNEYFKEIF